ncbi:TPA: hypothetical protein LU109_003595 [Enterobacter hormaechei subsp. xiangfangensis]|nr:hypothetical protein [Enterobacter hormaechei subsp. xiangfangensis]
MGDRGQTGVLHARLLSSEKIRYIWQAHAEGLTLEEWVVKHLNEVCDKAGTKKPDEN